MNLSRYAPEVRAFFANVLSTGATINAPALTALSKFVNRLQGRAALWSKLDEIYPFVGQGIAAACVKLKYTDTPFLTNHNFTDEDFEEWGPNAGLKSDGATKYLDTNFPATNLRDNCHLSYLEYSATGGGGPTARKAIGVTDGSLEWSLGAQSEIDDRTAIIGNQSASLPTPYANFSSWYLANRTAHDHLELWKRTLLKSTNTAAATLSPKPALNLVLAARNNIGAPDQFFSQSIRFASIGESFTPTEILDFYNAVQALQLDLGRTV